MTNEAKLVNGVAETMTRGEHLAAEKRRRSEKAEARREDIREMKRAEKPARRVPSNFAGHRRVVRSLPPIWAVALACAVAVLGGWLAAWIVMVLA